jgi:exopolysaccharide biosynthesis polyprenyl glycosylphosphotransferase
MAQTHGFVLPFSNGRRQQNAPSAHLDGHRTDLITEGSVDAARPTADLDTTRLELDAVPASVVERAVVGVEPATITPEGFARWSRRYVRWLALADTVIGVGVTLVVTSLIGLNSNAQRYILAAVFGLLTWPLMVAVMLGYARSRVGIARDEARSVLYAATAVVVGIAFFCGLFQHAAMLKTVVLGIPFAAATSLVVRWVSRRSLVRSQAQGQRVRTVVIAGTVSAVVALRDRFASEPDKGVGVIGACVPAADVSRAQSLGIDVLGTLEDVPSVARRYACDAIAVTSDESTRDEYLRNLSWALQKDGVELLVDPGLVEVSRTRMHVRPLTGFPLLHIQQPRFDGWQRVAKRAADVTLTGAGLLVAAPLFLAIAVAIKLQDGGPVIFRQSRVGRDGNPFTMYKFRTMVTNAEELKQDLIRLNESANHLFKLKRDPRITKLGGFLRKFSLDELPQLFNVLGGSMSLVGPRPHLADEVARMSQLAHRRARVTPGVTGLWQVSGRSDLNETEAVRLDLRYVENWSLSLDLLILWRTASAVLMRRGAH